MTLEQPKWVARRHAHVERVRAWTDAHKERARRGEKHPVYDFLFGYYHYRPAWLLQWHPGPDIVLAGEAAQEFLRWPEYGRTTDGVALFPEKLAKHRREFVVWLQGMLIAMQTRSPFYGCFGLHEWAMVYQQTPAQVRHNTHPLRFPPEEIARIVEASALCCTHYDAFRFFTPPAQPLNRQQPTRRTSADFEQRGCLHANMDLYKWSFKLARFTDSELVADCFALAREIREVDMRASPYDLRPLGFSPIAVETPEGRTEYEHHQRIFAARGEPLRERLLAVCNWLLARC